MAQDDSVSATFGAADVVVDPPEYIPYMASELDREVPAELSDRVHELLADVETDGGSNPMSLVAAAFYVAMKHSGSYSVTQREIADAAGLTEVTIRNNYRQFQADS
jgi:transcription initiation factor TFIIB